MDFGTEGRHGRGRGRTNRLAPFTRQGDKARHMGSGNVETGRLSAATAKTCIGISLDFLEGRLALGPERKHRHDTSLAYLGPTPILLGNPSNEPRGTLETRLKIYVFHSKGNTEANVSPNVTMLTFESSNGVTRPLITTVRVPRVSKDPRPGPSNMQPTMILLCTSEAKAAGHA